MGYLSVNYQLDLFLIAADTFFEQRGRKAKLFRGSRGMLLCKVLQINLSGMQFPVTPTAEKQFPKQSLSSLRNSQ